MKLISSAALLLASLLLSALVSAECMLPAAPALPDGGSAELQAMVAAQQAVKAYVSEAEVYLDCMVAEGEIAGADATPEDVAARTDLYNSAVDQMEMVAEKFNEEIREYKAKAQ